MQTWIDCFTECLKAAILERPGMYRFPVSEAAAVAEKMRPTFPTGGFVKDTPAVKATCKQLGIKCTYKAIAHFIANHE